MEQKEIRISGLSAFIWQKLEGKKLVIAGPESRQKQIFSRCLAQLNEENGAFTLDWGLENVGKEDYVLLFGVIEEKESPAILEKLLAQMELLAGRKTAGAVLISDSRVYGKCFGVPHRLKEEELGYICHTSALEMNLQCMRTAEHFAHRLAAEEAVPICVARGEETQTEKGTQQMIGAALKVLFLGKPGECYNLPGDDTSAETEKEDRSPFLPVKILTDTEKTEKLCFR